MTQRRAQATPAPDAAAGATCRGAVSDCRPDGEGPRAGQDPDPAARGGDDDAAIAPTAARAPR